MSDQVENSVKKPQEEVVVSAAIQQIYQGPLPPSKEFDAYDKTRPGTADDIIEIAHNSQRIAEKALDHQMYMDRQEVSISKRKLWLMFILGLVGQIGSILVTLAGYFMAYLCIKEGAFRLASVIALSTTAISGCLIWWKSKKDHKQ